MVQDTEREPEQLKKMKLKQRAAKAQEQFVPAEQGSTTASKKVQASNGLSNAGNTGPTSVKEPLRFTNPAEFDITHIIVNHSKGEGVLRELREGVLTVSRRRLLIQIIVAFLVENGGRKLYPSSEQKTALAKAVVMQYPTLQDTTPGAKGYEYLYDKGHGFIEYRLKTLRSYDATHHLGQRKRVAEAPTKPLTEHNGSEPAVDEGDDMLEPVSQEILQKVQWMKYHHPSPDNVTLIKSKFKETFPHRKEEIRKGRLTIAEVLIRYPRYQDMPSLIDLDFQLEFGHRCDNLVSSWRHDLLPKIMAVGRNNSSAAVSSTIERFEQGNASNAISCKKGSKKSSESRSAAVGHLFQHEPVGTDVAGYAERKPEKLTQPFLLCLGPDTDPEQFFLVLHRKCVPAGENVVAAFDRLFKAFYVFDKAMNIESPQGNATVATTPVKNPREVTEPATVPVSTQGTAAPRNPLTTAVGQPPAKKLRQEFDIRAILTRRREGEYLVREMEEGLMSYKSRKMIVNTLVSHLIDHYGTHVKSHVKLTLARAITQQFPLLDNVDGYGHEAWFTPARGYNDASGFLESRLRNVRRREYSVSKPAAEAGPSKVQSSVPENIIDDDAEDSAGKLEWLRDHHQPVQQVKKWMSDTVKSRAAAIRADKDKPVSELLQLYPRLLDTDGMNVLLYVEKQVKHWKEHLQFSGEMDTDTKKSNLAFQALPLLFPPGRKRGKRGLHRATVDEALRSFIRHEEIGTNIPTFVETLAQNQPFVLTLRKPEEPEQCFVVLEKNTISCNSLLHAIDVCFKLVYVLDIDYAWECQHTWDFIQKFFYRLREGKGRVKSVPSVTLFQNFLAKKL
ncbi:uncharacterized protein [Diadema setosum]|uniref:uncharacterized protein n=1 Tax=Diadema setosum TaxID=31175 RepID=UPI003B3B47F0